MPYVRNVGPSFLRLGDCIYREEEIRLQKLMSAIGLWWEERLFDVQVTSKFMCVLFESSEKHSC